MTKNAKLYREVSAKLSPCARSVYAFMCDRGSISALDAMRSHLGLSSGSLTRRLTELRDAGFSISRVTNKDPISGRRYSRYTLGV